MKSKEEKQGGTASMNGKQTLSPATEARLQGSPDINGNEKQGGTASMNGKQTLSPSLSHNGEGDAELGTDGKKAPVVELRLCMTKAVNGWVIEERGGDMRVVEGSAQTYLGRMLMTNIEGLLEAKNTHYGSIVIKIC